MSEAMAPHGAVSWIELTTTDVAAAKTFYAQLLGWTTEDVTMADMSYTMVKNKGADIGGMMAMPPQMEAIRPQWGAYITVEDVDATAKKAAELGADILVPPSDIPDVGRFALIKDPQGATLSVITYLNR